MTGVNNSMRVGNMPDNCGMKGMHENHANHIKHAEHSKKSEALQKQNNVQMEKTRDEKLGNKLDVTV